MEDNDWQQARLIPTSGINGQDEAERRATSALLAVMSVVRDFGTALVKPLGAPAGALETFIEVPFEHGDRRIYPDGLIRARRGTKTWTALVEVKTGTSTLASDQLESYLDVARDNGFNALLTISNEISHAPGVHPTTVDKRRLRKVELHHFSWAQILTLAVQHRVYHGVSDPEQAWILGELIRYLEHPKSGAIDFSDMGESWTGVRDSVLAGTLRATDKGLTDVVLHWEQLMQFIALHMGRELGADVEVPLSRKEQADPSLRLANQSASMVAAGRLTGAVRVPQAIGDLDVIADLRAGRVEVSVEVAAPKEGRQLTRVNWLLRQLKDAPPQLRVDSISANSRGSMSELLTAARQAPEKLVEDQKKDIRTFRVTATSQLGTKRGAGRGGFSDSVLSAVEGFYKAVVQDLRPWIAKAPQLPADGSAVEQAGIDVTPPPLDLQEDEEESTDVVSSDDTDVRPGDGDGPGIVTWGSVAARDDTDDEEASTL